MILTCENCQTQFNVDADKIGLNGRKVRCASCGHIWLASPPGAEKPQVEKAAAPEKPVKAEPEVKKEPKEAAATKPIVAPKRVEKTAADPDGDEQSAIPFLKAAACVLVVLNVVAFVFCNKNIIGQTSFYDLVGQYDTKAVEIENHTLTNNQPAKGTNIQIAWSVKNTSTSSLRMPNVRFRIYDEKLKNIGEKISRRADQKVQAGEEMKFKDTLIQPDKVGRYFTVEIGNQTELATR